MPKLITLGFFFFLLLFFSKVHLTGMRRGQFLLHTRHIWLTEVTGWGPADELLHIKSQEPPVGTLVSLKSVGFGFLWWNLKPSKMTSGVKKPVDVSDQVLSLGALWHTCSIDQGVGTDHVTVTFSFYWQQCIGNSLEITLGCKILLQIWAKYYMLVCPELCTTLGRPVSLKK